MNSSYLKGIEKHTIKDIEQIQEKKEKLLQAVRILEEQYMEANNSRREAIILREIEDTKDEIRIIKEQAQDKAQKLYIVQEKLKDV